MRVRTAAACLLVHLACQDSSPGPSSTPAQAIAAAASGGAGAASPDAPDGRSVVPQAATSTATPTATATPTVAAIPAATPAAAATQPPPDAVASATPLLLAATAVEPAGPAPLSLDAETVVDPAASFAIELAAAVRDARLVLLDPRDAHVPAVHAREVGATTRFSLAPARPLVPGSRYVLRLEGASGREMRDASGGALAPLSIAVLAAGTPPPPEPKRRTRRRR